MRGFTHPDARAARVLYRKVPGGGYVSDTLVITPLIPVDPTHPDFDAQRLAELETAAVMYAKSKGSVFQHILMEEGGA